MANYGRIIDVKSSKLAEWEDSGNQTKIYARTAEAGWSQRLRQRTQLNVAGVGYSSLLFATNDASRRSGENQSWDKHGNNTHCK